MSEPIGRLPGRVITGLALLALVAVLIAVEAIAGLALAIRQLTSPGALVRIGGMIQAVFSVGGLIASLTALAGTWGVAQGTSWGRAVALVGAGLVVVLTVIALLINPTIQLAVLAIAALVAAAPIIGVDRQRLAIRRRPKPRSDLHR